MTKICFILSSIFLTACGNILACPFPSNVRIEPDLTCAGTASQVKYDPNEGDPRFKIISTTAKTEVVTPASGYRISPDGWTVTWDEPGIYIVKMTVSITSKYGATEITKEASATKTVRVCGLTKVVARQGGVERANSDVNGNGGNPGYACVGNVVFDAYSDTSGNQFFPVGEPTWKIHSIGGGAPQDAGSGPNITWNFTDPGRYQIKAKCGDHEKQLFLTVVKAELVATKNWIGLNDDDDNMNGYDDVGETGIANENDIKLLTMTALPDPVAKPGSQVTLSRNTATFLNVYRSSDKSAVIGVGGANILVTGLNNIWTPNSPASQTTKWNYDRNHLYMEGIKVGATTLTLEFTYGGIICLDTKIINVYTPLSLRAVDSANVANFNVDDSKCVEPDIATIRVPRAASGTVNITAIFDGAVPVTDNAWDLVKQSGSLGFAAAPLKTPGSISAQVSKSTKGTMTVKLQNAEMPSKSYLVRIIVYEVSLQVEILDNLVPGEAGVNVVAGQPFRARITAVDLAGVTVATYAGTIKISTMDAAVTLPTGVNAVGEYTFVAADNGSHTFPNMKLRTVANFNPTRRIKVEDVGDPTITGEIEPLMWWNPICTEENPALVGQETSSGHIIVPNDHFVALPALASTIHHKQVRVRHGTNVQDTEVLEKGPHFPNSVAVIANLGVATDDSYWHTTGIPRVESVDWEQGNNNSGIDIAEGTFIALGSPNLQRVFWRFR